MTILQAIILGAVQGLTEFIPVSSSGHLVIFHDILNWHGGASFEKSFDVMMHLGSLVAVLVYFRKDWVRIIRGFYLRSIKKVETSKDDFESKLLIPLIVACIPAAIVGVLFDDMIEQKLSKWYYVAIALVIGSVIILAAEFINKKRREISQMNYADYLTIGFAQAIALFPGISRSGITISAGMFRGLDRAAAARFSFLLSTPIILGAGVMKLKDLFEMSIPHDQIMAIVLGFVSAAIFGYIAIGFLVKFLSKKNMIPFVIYRLCLVAGLAIYFLR